MESSIKIRHFGNGGGDSHIKQMGMLVVSLRGVNFGFWSHLGCSGQRNQYFKPPRSRLGFREETQNYAKRNRSQIFFLTCFVYRITSVIINQRFLQIVENIIIRLISDNKGSVIVSLHQVEDLVEEYHSKRFKCEKTYSSQTMF